MDYSKLYFVHMTREFDVDHLNVTSPLDYVQAKAVAQGELAFGPVLQLRRVSRGKSSDFTTNDRPYLKVLSGRFFAALEAHDFSGWRSIPAHVENLPRSQAQDYRVLVVTGRSGDIDWRLSGRALRRSPYQGPNDSPGKVFVGCMFPADTWDGSDIFFPGKAGWLMVTERVKLALQDAGVTGMVFDPLDTYEYMDYGQLERAAQDRGGPTPHVPRGV